MHPSYIISDEEDLKKLFEQSLPDIKTMIKGGEVKETTTTLGRLYNRPIGEEVCLSNIITFASLGSLH